ncbi:MAG TPA: NAD(P)H-hydrate dehydratase [Sphingomicrobium sp.]|nr:NAD(P)H-hydrate dehydratase [Sphingomicrobium sp.]
MKRAKELTRSALRAFPLPRQSDTGKEGHGRLLIVAGSRQVPGAALLAAMAALRTGAGKVRVATVASVAPGIALQMPEVLVVPLAESRDGNCTRSSVGEVREQADAMDAVVAGPGVRKGSVTAMIGKALLASGRPMALDAGVLHNLPPLATQCRDSETAPVLLPHSREMAALLGVDEDEVEADRLGAAHKAAEHYGAYVLAKGAESHVAAPDGRAWTFRGGAPGLGIAGSGDTLAGIVGGLLARGAEPLTALLWGVLLHGEAGEALSRKIGTAGFLAREIPGEIPALLDR